ncbi:MAG: hypothetical protein ABI268_05405, partial [Rhodanobacter sp.]
MSYKSPREYQRSKAKADDESEKATYSPTCEVRDCKTRWVPESNGFPERREVGLTAVLVDDFTGKRAICGDHYLAGLVKAGKHPNQELMKSDGSMSYVLMREHWA